MEGLSGRASGSADAGRPCSFESSRARDDGRRQSGGSHHAESLKWPFDVLQGQAAKIGKARLEPACDSLVNSARDQYASCRRLCFQSRCNVHAVAVEIISLDDHVAKMKTDAEYDSLRVGPSRVDVVHGLLELDRRRQGVDGAGELYERAVADQLDQPAAIPRDRWVEAPLSMLAQSRQCSTLVAPHEAGVADDVGSENRHQFALVMDHGNFPRSLCRTGCRRARRATAFTGATRSKLQRPSGQCAA